MEGQDPDRERVDHELQPRHHHRTRQVVEDAVPDKAGAQRDQRAGRCGAGQRVDERLDHAAGCEAESLEAEADDQRQEDRIAEQDAGEAAQALHKRGLAIRFDQEGGAAHHQRQVDRQQHEERKGPLLPIGLEDHRHADEDRVRLARRETVQDRTPTLDALAAQADQRSDQP